jgi:hypothetical protein
MPFDIVWTKDLPKEEKEIFDREATTEFERKLGEWEVTTEILNTLANT